MHGRRRRCDRAGDEVVDVALPANGTSWSTTYRSQRRPSSASSTTAVAGLGPEATLHQDAAVRPRRPVDDREQDDERRRPRRRRRRARASTEGEGADASRTRRSRSTARTFTERSRSCVRTRRGVDVVRHAPEIGARGPLASVPLQGLRKVTAGIRDDELGARRRVAGGAEGSAGSCSTAATPPKKRFLSFPQREPRRDTRPGRAAARDGARRPREDAGRGDRVRDVEVGPSTLTTIWTSRRGVGRRRCRRRGRGDSSSSTRTGTSCSASAGPASA